MANRNYLVLVLIVAFSLTGCGGMTATKMVTQYEIMGKALARSHDTGVKLCAEKVLSQEDCDRIKKIYNDTRKIYIVTGDTLKFAIEMEGTNFSDPANQQYQVLTKAFSELTLQWLRLTTELGLIKEDKR